MQQTRIPIILLILASALALLTVSLTLAQEGAGKTTPDAAQEEGAAETAVSASRQPANPAAGASPPGSLLIGVDDVTIEGVLVDVNSNGFYSAFIGLEVWGAAYDRVAQTAYVVSNTHIYQWSYGAGPPSFLGTIFLSGTSTTTPIAGLAHYNGTLYASRTFGGNNSEGIYELDLSTPPTISARLVTTFTVSANNLALGGLAIDPATGTFYATNDDTSWKGGRGLVAIARDGTPTLIAPYPAGETDIDGLAYGDRKAFLVTDQPGSIYVFDFDVMTYTKPLNNPWSTFSSLSGATWYAVPGIAVTKTVGVTPGVCSDSSALHTTQAVDVQYCFQAGNTGNVTLRRHDLEDSHLGTIVKDIPRDLRPGETLTFLPATRLVTATTVNTITWTAYNTGKLDMVTASDTAAVNFIQPAAFPVCAGFERGSLPGFIYPETTSSGPANGRVAVTNFFPHSGSYALDLDTDCTGCGGNTTQAAVMVVDLAGQSNAYLNFWVHEHNDENHPEDGVFISDDGGATWAPILSLNNFLNSYQHVSIDLAAAATGAGMNLVDGFRIKFQSSDNLSIPSDGYSFDDICVEPRLPDIELVKTVGTDPVICATTDTIEVSSETDVTYCYKVTNTGNVPFGQHDLDDNELGNILSGFPFTLLPGNSMFITQTATISATTVNTATWTAYNPGPTDLVTASDTATVSFVYVVNLPFINKP